MYLNKLVLFAALVAVAYAISEFPADDLQAEETSITHTRQKRAPLLLKKLLIGGLLAKKALLIGGGAGLVGGAVSHKLLSKNGGRYPVYINNNPSAPIYQDRPPVYYDYPPSSVPVYPVKQPEYPYPPAPAPSPAPHYGVPIFINTFQPKPQSPPLLPPPSLPQPPSYNPDCYTGSSPSLSPPYNTYNSASASSSNYA